MNKEVGPALCKVNNDHKKNMKKDGFRLATVAEDLEKCIDGDDVLTNAYLDAYGEILKCFRKMGMVFSFVTEDLEAKMRILQEYRSRKDGGEHFTSLARMISYELSNGATTVAKPPSGCRTWLRLHRALQFVASLFSALGTADFEGKMGPIAQKCYKQSLANYHDFFTRTGATLAMLGLPSIKKFLSNAQDDEQDHRRLCTSIGTNAERVYDLSQKLIASKDLLNLP